MELLLYGLTSLLILLLPCELYFHSKLSQGFRRKCISICF